MPMNVFLDESISNDSYYIVTSEVPTTHCRQFRTSMRKFSKKAGRAIHMYEAPPPLKKHALQTVLEMNAEHVVFSMSTSSHTNVECRMRCLEAVVDYFAHSDVAVLTLDRSNTMGRDAKVLANFKTSQDRFVTYRHIPSHQEPLLWLPDIVAWSYARGGRWRESVQPIIREVINLQ